MTFWNFNRVFLKTTFLETMCKISRYLTNRLLWNLVRIFSVTFTRYWRSNIFQFLTISKIINKKRRNFWNFWIHQKQIDPIFIIFTKMKTLNRQFLKNIVYFRTFLAILLQLILFGWNRAHRMAMQKKVRGYR